MRTYREILLILFSLLFSFILSVLYIPETWPQWLGWFRPSWTYMVIIFLAIELTNRLGLMASWLAGLILDVLVADLLGLNAILLVLVTYGSWQIYERFRMYSIVQQCLLIFLILFLVELIKGVFQEQSWGRELSMALVLPAFASMFVWPIVRFVLRKLTTWAEVS